MAGCARCGAPVESRDRKKVRARYCGTCRRERQREGQLARWAATRRDKPGERPRRCALPGCAELVPSRRRYCSTAHYHQDRRGQEGVRRGAAVFCNDCGKEIGYLRPSRIRRSRRHRCPDCLADWRRSQPPQPKVPSYGIICGHVVSKPGVLRCQRCERTRKHRGPYQTEAARRVLAVQKTFPASGRKITMREWAHQAEVSVQTLYNVLERLERVGRFGRTKLPAEPASHPGIGTPAGFRWHRTRRETPCLPCRKAERERARRRYHERKAGIAPPPRSSAARCGTISGAVRHRRRREPLCDDCRAVEREYESFRRRRAGMAPRRPAAHGTTSGYNAHRRGYRRRFNTDPLTSLSHKPSRWTGPSGRGPTIKSLVPREKEWLVAFNFLPCDHDQDFLLPPSLREWLPEDHLAWFVADAVASIDLSGFYASYREDGWGRAAFDPQMMVALLLYAYAVGERSSRGIERRCREDVAFRVITGNQLPDHATIARFRARHEGALAEIFTQVLALCAEAGLVSVGLVALDGTKVKANASKSANRSYAAISAEVERMLAEAAAADAEEDELLGDRRGDELPAELASRSSRLARLRAAKARLEADAAEQRAAYEARLAARAALEAERGRPLRGRKPKAPPEAVAPSARANTSDPDSALVHAAEGFVQGYNGQLVATSTQIVIAAELSTDSPDGRLLAPMAEAAERELAAAGVEEKPTVLLADAGYWNVPQIERVEASGTEVLVATDSGSPQRRKERDGRPRKLRDKRMEGAYLAMHRKLATQRGRELLPIEEADRRARLRPDQGRPARRPLHATRLLGLPLGMEADDGDAQPAEALEERTGDGLRHRVRPGTRLYSSHTRRRPTPLLRCMGWSGRR